MYFVTDARELRYIDEDVVWLDRIPYDYWRKLTKRIGLKHRLEDSEDPLYSAFAILLSQHYETILISKDDVVIAYALAGLEIYKNSKLYLLRVPYLIKNKTLINYLNTLNPEMLCKRVPYFSQHEGGSRSRWAHYKILS